MLHVPCTSCCPGRCHVLHTVLARACLRLLVQPSRFSTPSRRGDPSLNNTSTNGLILTLNRRHVSSARQIRYAFYRYSYNAMPNALPYVRFQRLPFADNPPSPAPASLRQSGQIGHSTTDRGLLHARPAYSYTAATIQAIRGNFLGCCSRKHSCPPCLVTIARWFHNTPQHRVCPLLPIRVYLSISPLGPSRIMVFTVALRSR